ncbi:unnamed protein product, partial [marine sediment metagenome]
MANVNWIQRLLARLGLPVGASLAADIATVDTVVDGIKAQTDKIAAKMLFTMDFWSDLVEEVVVTGTQGTVVITGGNVVVADLPDTATIVRAIVMMKFRMV